MKQHLKKYWWIYLILLIIVIFFLYKWYAYAQCQANDEGKPCSAITRTVKGEIDINVGPATGLKTVCTFWSGRQCGTKEQQAVQGRG